MSDYTGCGYLGKCGAKVKSRGLCATHYQQLRRSGDLADFPVTQVYDREEAHTMVMHILNFHGRELVDSAISIWDEQQV